ncbi:MULTISPECIES: leucine--tRNA ligase [unclassified Nocardioides]|uniref:leucine--tRNA ligase n=1 Tax=unclassified Nocardioides TaxID=2615069 RepID=UPI0006F2259E|nr:MULTISPECIES: leucine--tRNA ligase [unclassified Nocardioides]KQY54569.1 leucine--tRNA ligase [Nocardioides sp. Root140]KRF19644.1 leucine--tRNA ligase [Nocardioides sp. Soil796]
MSEQVERTQVDSVDTDREATYDVMATQDRWQQVWEDLAPFVAHDDSPREKRYALTMFPYPSGDLHMGHAEVTALHDVIARYWWQKGYEVLNPMGWDSFGLPAENAAIKNDTHPATYTYANIETQFESFKKYGLSFDWTRRLHTSDPEYYRWTQWLFLKLREQGLAYRKNSPVNWCPNDQTVLANEQVVDGACERCGAEVTKRELTQWYFRTTAYAQELLDCLDDLQENWSDKVVNAQRNWIGRSEGAHVDFVIEGRAEPVTVYTTRPDTIFGTTFMVVAVDAPLAEELVTDERRTEFETYREEIRRETEIERLSTDRPKTGVDLGVTATNPVTGAQIPVWATDYVLADYGTGAVMGVPGGDQRDWQFATQMGLPIVRTTEPPADFEGEAFHGEGPTINSPAAGVDAPLDINGLPVDEAKSTTISYLQDAGLGRGTVNFRLRDWLLSRQRYWGAPIPIIHCPVDGEVPVPEDQLPVVLPDLRGADLKPKGVSPLGAATDWVNVACPTCGGPAKRDTDTMDTFVDSSWYFLRYLSPNDDTRAFDPALAEKWGPCDLYIGGDEHAVLHLLYARFFTKAMRDMGLISWDEPFSAYLSQGKVINNGRKMSKSLGNGINLGDQLAEFGVDAVRLTLVFASPPEDNIDWADVSPAGSAKFLQRAWRLSGDVASEPGADPAAGDVALRKVTHRTLHDGAALVESYRFNVLVARIMELVNATRKAIDSGCGPADPAVREATEAVSIMLSLVAPYTAEEMWHRLGHEPTVARAGWPVVDEALLVEDSVVAVVQVQGKVKARLDVSPDVSEADLEAAALADPAIVKALEGKTVRKVIVRAPKLVNIVAG